MTDRIRSVVAEILGDKPKPEQEPAPPDISLPENQAFNAAPPALDGDLYLQVGGGYGNRSWDQAEQARIEREQQQAKARREARASEQAGVISPNAFLSKRIDALEERLAKLETLLTEAKG